MTIVYGRPLSKKAGSGEARKIWGSLVPFGQAWRLGADEATLLTTQKDIQFGDTTVPAGAYTLYMVPEENGGKLAISKSLGAWGIPVDEKHDLARVDLKKESLEKPNEQLAIAVDKNSSGGGVVKIMWEGALVFRAIHCQKINGLRIPCRRQHRLLESANAFAA